MLPWFDYLRWSCSPWMGVASGGFQAAVIERVLQHLNKLTNSRLAIADYFDIGTETSARPSERAVNGVVEIKGQRDLDLLK